MIVMADIIWYILDVLVQTLAELRRLLKPSGILLLKQSYLPAGKQQYGTNIISRPEDEIRFVQEAGFGLRHKVLLNEPNGDVCCIISTL